MVSDVIFAADVVSADLTDVISSVDVVIVDVICSAWTGMVETVVDDDVEDTELLTGSTTFTSSSSEVFGVVDVELESAGVVTVVVTVVLVD